MGGARGCKQVEGGIRLTGKITPPMWNNGEMEMRLLIGYGDPFEGGFSPIVLTNDGTGKDHSYPLAYYSLEKLLWKLQ